MCGEYIQRTKRFQQERGARPRKRGDKYRAVNPDAAQVPGVEAGLNIGQGLLHLNAGKGQVVQEPVQFGIPILELHD